ncbi:MAG: GH32 C-terminal domain-containing protein [Bacteroidales bacterium]|nr:GH32 C-terminal domain-containing protein [Bacteroidales bacterium]
MRKFILYILAFLPLTSVLYGQPLFHVGFDEENGTVTSVEQIGSQSIPLANHQGFPERIEGVAGKALRLDGYSTWGSLQDYSFSEIGKQITVEAWFAPEAFNAEKSALVSQHNGNTGFSLEIGPYGHVSWVIFADFIRYEVISETRLQPYSWYHIAGIADLNTSTMTLYINGSAVATTSLNSHETLTTGSSTLFIGRHSNSTLMNGFLVTAANGALDEVKIHNTALDQATITGQCELYSDKVPDLSIDPDVRFAGDYLRPQYHVMPNTSWTNESYGLIYYDGLYHLFSQKNPNAPQLYFMHWGHYSSPDLVQWREKKIALAPEPGFDSYGVWSGTTIADPKGVPAIVYTGVDGAKAGIGLAYPDDDSLISWTRYEGNPLIPHPPTGYNHMDFRDPYVWKTNDTYYMIVGSGLQSGGGILWTYKSTDLIVWENIQHLYNDNNVERSGKFWEMPFFYQLNENDYMLCVTPIPWEGVRAQTIYWIGSWEDEKFTPYFTEPKKFEWIQENFLSPSVGTDEEGRAVYIGIIPEDRSGADQVAAGWRQTFSIPRVMRLLSDTTIGHTPHPNLCRLRNEHTRITNRVVEPGTNLNIPEITGNQLELHFKIKYDSASVFQVQVFKHEDMQEFTSIRFSTNYHYLIVDRKLSSLSNTLKDERSSRYYFNHNDTLDVRIFLDHSILEVFVDQTVVLSNRVYPSREQSNKVDLVTMKGRAEIIELDAWDLKSKTDLMDDIVCEPDNLPDAIPVDPLTSIPEKKSPEKSSDHLSVYPNPVSDMINLDAYIPGNGNISVEIRNISGMLVGKKEFTSPDGWLSASIPANQYASGIYMLTISSRTTSKSKSFIIL